MTPRQVDVVFVLEQVPGVLAVHAVDGHAWGMEFAIEMAHGARHLAAAHYALLRVMRHEECRRVLFFEARLPPMLAGRVRRMTISGSERDAARARVPLVTPALAQESEPQRVRRSDFSILLIDTTHETYAAVVTAFGAAARRVVLPDPRAALAAALDETFDLIVCPARVAFGRSRLLYDLRTRNASAAHRVVVVAHPQELLFVLNGLERIGCTNSCLLSPIDPDDLRSVADYGGVAMNFRIHVPPPRPVERRREPARRSVLIVDDDPRSHALAHAAADDTLRITTTDDPWEALEALAEGPDLVLCSATLRVGETPIYRLLWEAHPEAKSRFLLLVPRDYTPSSARARALARPATTQAIRAALDALRE